MTSRSRIGTPGTLPKPVKNSSVSWSSTKMMPAVVSTETKPLKTSSSSITRSLSRFERPRNCERAVACASSATVATASMGFLTRP